MYISALTPNIILGFDGKVRKGNKSMKNTEERKE
jgi:hypothetical protein